MEKPKHQIEALTSDWPSRLKPLEEAASSVGVTVERLRGLADSGFAPHYRIDGGDPLFRISELKDWVRDNLVTRSEAKDLPEPVRVVVRPSEAIDFRGMPASLREIVGLCDITDETRRIGIYFLCFNGDLLYIGQSTNAASRVAIHQARCEFDTVFFLPWPRHDLDRIEAALIRTLRPPLNAKNENGSIQTSFKDATQDIALIDAIRTPDQTQDLRAQACVKMASSSAGERAQ
jgi:hypothetical protein